MISRCRYKKVTARIIRLRLKPTIYKPVTARIRGKKRFYFTEIRNHFKFCCLRGVVNLECIFLRVSRTNCPGILYEFFLGYRCISDATNPTRTVRRFSQRIPRDRGPPGLAEINGIGYFRSLSEDGTVSVNSLGAYLSRHTQ